MIMWLRVCTQLVRQPNRLLVAKVTRNQNWNNFDLLYDYDFPEMVRLLALKEAKLMIVPTAIISKWDHDIRMVPPVRAYENSVFLAFVNHVGPQRDVHFSGGTCCVDPHGVKVVHCWGQESLLTATIDTTECEKSELKFLVDRRPEIYCKN